MTKTVLVTGGAGFIGSNLCQRLIDDGNKVICVDNFFTGRKQNIASLLENKDFELIEEDITKPFKVKVDAIYNLACPASPPKYQHDPVKTLRTSVIGTLNMLELAKSLKVPILQASTSEVYGDPDVHPQPESYWGHVNPIGIRSCYDEGKRVAETLMFDYKRQYKVDIRVVRIFNTYGPNMDPGDGRVVSNFIVQALSNKDITIYGKGDQTRSFQYIDDLVNGLIKMMDNSTNYPGPVNIGNPEEFTIAELASIVLKHLPTSKNKLVFKPLPQDDPKQRKPDITLAKEKLNWQPVVNLSEGLNKTIDYFAGIMETEPELFV